MLALSVLDELVHLDGRGSWTYYMSNQGYLRHIIESMSVEDGELAQLLSPDPENVRALYVYESKMALLTRLASTVAGAELLLESGLMLRLSEMTIFSSRPDVTAAPSSNAMDVVGEEESLIPSPLARYHQILFPALRLCQALLSSLGAANRSASSQVRHFVASNEELVRSVLRGGGGARGPWTLSHLQELSLLTGVISRAFSGDDGEDTAATSAAEMDKSAHLTRVQRLMLTLVPLCDLSEEGLRRLKEDLSPAGRGRGFTLMLEVVANVMTFARKAATGSSSRVVAGKFFQVSFAPSLAEARERGESGEFATVLFSSRRII